MDEPKFIKISEARLVPLEFEIEPTPIDLAIDAIAGTLVEKPAANRIYSIRYALWDRERDVVLEIETTAQQIAPMRPRGLTLDEARFLRELGARE